MSADPSRPSCPTTTSSSQRQCSFWRKFINYATPPFNYLSSAELLLTCDEAHPPPAVGFFFFRRRWRVFATLLNTCSCHSLCQTAPRGTDTRLEIYAVLSPFFPPRSLASLLSDAAEQGASVLARERAHSWACGYFLGFKIFQFLFSPPNNTCNCEVAISLFM